MPECFARSDIIRKLVLHVPVQKSLVLKYLWLITNTTGNI
jgi:hypothetical protein